MKTLLLFLILFSFQLIAQDFNGRKFLDITVNTVYDEEKKSNLLSIETKIPNDYLIFEKDKDIYRAKYIMKLQLLNEEDDVVWSSTKESKIELNNFSYTNSRNKLSRLVFKTFIKAGNYRIKAQSLDERNKRYFSKIEKVEVLKNSASGIEFENVRFYDSVNKQIIKMSSLLFKKNDEAIQIRFSLNDLKKYNSTSIKLTATDSRSKVLYQKKEKLEHLKASADSYQIKLSKSYLINDEKFYVEFQLLDAQNKLLTHFKRTIYLNLARYPQTKIEMSKALDRMNYVASSDSIDFYKTTDLEISLRYFKSFWLSLSDKNSEDDAYQIMREYFRRVGLSNKFFSSNGENGWLTDRGRIYIKFGQPDEVLNFPFQSNSKPYVVWNYYTLRKQFVFVDYTGFNDYRLNTNSRQAEFN